MSGRRRVFAGLVSFSLLFSGPEPVRAQWVVTDPGNTAVNILQEIHSLLSNVNEAVMIANQLVQLENDLKNLTSFPFSIIEEYKAKLEGLFETLGSIEGLMQNLAELEGRFEELYPDFSADYMPVPVESVSADIQNRLRTTRSMIQGSLKTSAQVLENLPANQAQLTALMENSQSAVGILQAAQAGNQINASVASQLISLNSQLASYIQAHTAQIMEQNGAALASKNRMDHALDGLLDTYAPNPLRKNPF